MNDSPADSNTPQSNPLSSSSSVSMPNDNVVSLQAARDLRTARDEEHAYHARILSMSKLELLEEMVRFQEERSSRGHLTLQMMIQGQHLFRALEASAETQELRILTRSYRRHLECELTALRTGGQQG